MIPHIIHKIYISHDFNLPEKLEPEALKEAHDSWQMLNPGYIVKYWSHAACLDYLRHEFQDQIYYETFKSLLPYSYKCDFFRFCIVYKEGGYYSDWKQKCIVPLDEINDNNYDWISCLDTGNGYAKYYHCMGTGFFGCIPKHPVLKTAIDKIIENVHRKFYGSSCLDPTGPFLFGNAFLQNKNEMKHYRLGNFDWDNYFSFQKNDKVIKAVEHKCEGVAKDQNWKNGNNYADMWAERRVYL